MNKKTKLETHLHEALKHEYPEQIDNFIYERYGKKNKNFLWPMWLVTPIVILFVVFNINKSQTSQLPKSNLELITKMEMFDEDYEMFSSVSDTEWQQLLAGM